MFRHLQQPERSRVCGQTVVAMITGRSVEEVCQLIGKTGTTKLSDIKKALEHFGVKVGYPVRYNNRLKKNRPQLPEFCLIRLKRTSGRKASGHLTFYYKGTFYDPGAPRLFTDINEFLSHHTRLSFRKGEWRRVNTFLVDYYVPLEMEKGTDE